MPGLDEMVCFSLYAASRATTQAYRRVLAPFDLTYPQYLVLVTLWTTGPQSVGTLGDALALDSGTLSPLLRRLEKRGLTQRARRPGDERIVDISLTDLGHALRNRMRDVPGQIASCMDIGIDAAVALVDSLHSLTERLRESTEAVAS